MPIRPLHDRVIIRRVEESESKIGSLYIPDSAKEKPQRGQVVAVGAGKRLESGERAPAEVKPGDHILFGKYSGSEVKVDGEDMLIAREDEILAILD